MMTDFVLTSPRMCAFLPTVNAPVALIFPFTLPSISSSLRKVRSPSIETPLESTPPDLAPGDASAGRSVLVIGSSREVADASELFELDPNIDQRRSSQASFKEIKIKTFGN